MIDYKSNKITWQAHVVKEVDEECLKNGKYPNGQKLSKVDREKLEEEIKACTDILINYGCTDNQLVLF